MKANWTVENQCFTEEGDLKAVKVYNYDDLNEVVNVVSHDLTVYGSQSNFVGFWKIKNSTLISMTDFVLEQETLLRNNSDYTNAEAILKCINYANFFKQTQEKWMFVPCDEDGNVLELPDNEDMQYWDLHQKNIFNEDKNKYQQAKERCLFEGFEYNQMGFVYLNEKGCALDEEYMKKNTIEFLVKYNIQLTPTALKQIGL